MNDWITARKGSTGLYIEYGNAETNSLHGYNTQIREEPEFEIRIDLSPNLRIRNKQDDQYPDARALADGEMSRLTLLQIEDAKIVEAIVRSLKRFPKMPTIWRLTLNLQQVWSFKVEPELSPESLSLHVR